MKRFKKYPIQIWFLSEDLRQSASWLTKKTLESSIKGCLSALMSAYFYQYGIKNKKFYSYYFCKERKDESIDKFFPLWPSKKIPTLLNYTTKTSKWARKCREHFDYVRSYLEILLEEYMVRSKHEHPYSVCLEWLKYDAPELKLPYGNIKKIVLEWKCLNPKYRRKDIIQGYRLQFLSQFDNYETVVSEYNISNKDIPEFISEYFKLSII